MGARAAVIVVILASALCACSTNQSPLNPAADQAAQSDVVWRTMLLVCGIMYVLVMAFLASALWRARRNHAAETAPAIGRTPAEPVLERTLTGWTVLIVLGLTVLVTVSFLVDRSLAKAGPDPLKVTVTANQWWWKVQYEGSWPDQQISTANELHMPLGRSAIVTLKTNDVIHSFWVPNLSGKEDLVPGRDNDLIITPRRTGIYRGQCAEFCGLQHAKMAFAVVVEEPKAFEAWRQAQLKTAIEPTAPAPLHGKQVFMAKGCASCHRISGTDAGGATGPDLTHLASRPTIAAGTLPNDRGSLLKWVADPQGIKPGTQMPRVKLDQSELSSVVAYLETME